MTECFQDISTPMKTNAENSQKLVIRILIKSPSILWTAGGKAATETYNVADVYKLNRKR